MCQICVFIMSSVKLNLVVAACSNRGIGVNGQLPWRIRGDMAFFKRITSETKTDKQNAVIMGRKTWESIPDKFKPLPNRINIVISNTIKEVPSGVHLATGFEEAVNLVSSPELGSKVDGVYIIGGHSVYKAALEHSTCYRIYLTQVEGDYNCDTFLPEFDTLKFPLTKLPDLENDWKEENGIRYKFEVYEKACGWPMTRPFNVMVAMCSTNRGFGYKGAIPWPSISEDYQYYMKVTSQVSQPGRKCVNIKGRMTWEDTGLPEKSRDNLMNIVVSSTLKGPPDEHVHAVVKSFDAALHLLSTPPLSEQVETIWIMGGGEVYETALKHPQCHGVCLTKVHKHFDSDRFLYEFEKDYEKRSNPYAGDHVREENGVQFEFAYYERKPRDTEAI